MEIEMINQNILFKKHNQPNQLLRKIKKHIRIEQEKKTKWEIIIKINKKIPRCFGLAFVVLLCYWLSVNLLWM